MSSVRIPIGRRIFAPSWAFTALTAALCIVFFDLGRWQWHRGEQRQAQWEQFAAGSERVLPLGSQALQDVPRFQRVSLAGRFDPDHQFLLDNRSYQGRAGFEVLTPLHRSDGRVALVDRGWVPFSGMRQHLPDVALKPDGELTLVGRVADLPVAGLASGRAPPSMQAPWPKVTSFPTLDELSAALGSPLEPRIVLLDSQARDGYIRDWHPPGMEPLRHWSYAVQWWAFAVLAFVLWAVLSTRRPVETA